MSSLANDQCIDKIGAEIVCLNDVLLRLVAISTEQKPVILASAGFIQLVRLVGLEGGAIAGFCRGQGQAPPEHLVFWNSAKEEEWDGLIDLDQELNLCQIQAGTSCGESSKADFGILSSN